MYPRGGIGRLRWSCDFSRIVQPAQYRSPEVMVSSIAQAIMNSFSTDSSVCTSLCFGASLHLHTSGRAFA